MGWWVLLLFVHTTQRYAPSPGCSFLVDDQDPASKGVSKMKKSFKGIGVVDGNIKMYNMVRLAALDGQYLYLCTANTYVAVSAGLPQLHGHR